MTGVLQMNRLYEALPFLKRVSKQTRGQFERYFENAPYWVLDSVRVIELKKDTIFVRENTAVESIYLLGEGTVKAVDYRFYGEVFEFTSFHDLHAFGGMEMLMEDSLFRTTLQTVTPCTLVVIPAEIFGRWMSIDIQMLRIETKNTVTNLLEQGRTSRTYLFLQGSNRLAFVLIDAYKNCQKDGVLYVKNTRQELADSSGLCVKTVNRAVKKFEENGWITRHGNDFSIDKKQYKILETMISELIER